MVMVEMLSSKSKECSHDDNIIVNSDPLCSGGIGEGVRFQVVLWIMKAPRFGPALA